MLLAYARALVPDLAAAEDALHQVFLRLLKGDIRIAGEPLPYLCRAVRNAALNSLRRTARDVELEPATAWLESPPGAGELGIAIEQALASLPQEQREVVVLRAWGQLTFDEVAQALEIPANTAASRYRYALAKLREQLKPVETV